MSTMTKLLLAFPAFVQGMQMHNDNVELSLSGVRLEEVQREVEKAKKIESQLKRTQAVNAKLHQNVNEGRDNLSAAMKAPAEAAADDPEIMRMEKTFLEEIDAETSEEKERFDWCERGLKRAYKKGFRGSTGVEAMRESNGVKAMQQFMLLKDDAVVRFDCTEIYNMLVEPGLLDTESFYKGLWHTESFYKELWEEEKNKRDLEAKKKAAAKKEAEEDKKKKDLKAAKKAEEATKKRDLEAAKKKAEEATKKRDLEAAKKKAEEATKKKDPEVMMRELEAEFAADKDSDDYCLRELERVYIGDGYVLKDVEAMDSFAWNNPECLKIYYMLIRDDFYKRLWGL